MQYRSDILWLKYLIRLSSVSGAPLLGFKLLPHSSGLELILYE